MDATKNYGLKKPTYTDGADIEILNQNADIVDTELKKRADEATTAVQSATLGGAPVPLDGNTLQLPAYPTSLPANGGRSDSTSKLYTTSHPNDHSVRIVWDGGQFVAWVVCENDNTDKPILVTRCIAADTASCSSHWTSSDGAALRNITMSTAAPSGGQDGDVWHQYS